MIKLTVLSILAFTSIGLFLAIMILYVKKMLSSHDFCEIGINHMPSLTKKVEGGKTLLLALADEGISLPSPCGGKATCKQCLVRVLKGAEVILETDRSTFSFKELKEGWRLSCQLRVKKDLEIEIPEALLTLQSYQGTVISNENVATFIKELVLKIEGNQEISYVPGDYMQFKVPSFRTNTSQWKETIPHKYQKDWDQGDFFDKKVEFKQKEEQVIRAYSMASYPGEKGVLKFNVRIATPPMFSGKVDSKIPWGICSSYLFSLKPEDKVEFFGPFGHSHMIEDERELVFLIGGAGASFARSHILDLFLTKKTTRRVTLWYGARSLKENIYQEEYETLAKQFKNFNYKLVLSDPTLEDKNLGWPMKDSQKTGFLYKAFQSGIEKEIDKLDEMLFYVCGPPLHNKSVLELLDAYGVEKENIILDDFGS